MDATTFHLIPSSPHTAIDKKVESSDTTMSSVVAAPTASKNVSKVSRRPCNLPLETVEYLKAWMMSPEHITHPYPTEKEKQQIMTDTGIELKQLTNWFVNNRKRYWKPLVEAKLQKQQRRKEPNFKLTPASNNTNMFCPELITYPTSANAMFSIVPKIPVNNFTVPFTSSNFVNTITPNNSQNSFNNVAANVIESTHPTTGLDVFQLAVNYLPNSFTSLVSDSSSLNDEDEDSATAGASISSTTEPAVMGENSQDNLDYCPDVQSRNNSITEEYSEEDSLSNNKRSRNTINLQPTKIAKNEETLKWREACAKARHVNDLYLPSLDEATELFGFTN